VWKVFVGHKAAARMPRSHLPHGGVRCRVAVGAHHKGDAKLLAMRPFSGISRRPPPTHTTPHGCGHASFSSFGRPSWVGPSNALPHDCIDSLVPPQPQQRRQNDCWLALCGFAVGSLADAHETHINATSCLEMAGPWRRATLVHFQHYCVPACTLTNSGGVL
jgi:hypothetical protein